MDNRDIEKITDEIINKYGADIETALREESLLTANYINQTLKIARKSGDPKITMSALTLIVSEFANAYNMDIASMMMKIAVLAERTREEKKMRGL